MSNDTNIVDALVNTTLLTLTPNVERLRFTGEADTYITYQILNSEDADFAGDEGTTHDHSYRVDIFSRYDYIALLQQTKAAFKAAGFFGITVNAEMYEKDTEYYHASLDINFKEDL